MVVFSRYTRNHASDKRFSEAAVDDLEESSTEYGPATPEP